MAKIVNNDNLTFILTTYGLDRVTTALNDPETYINLTKIKVGDANGNYYEPNPEDIGLKHPIPDGEFRLVEKELLEDEETVSLLAVIPESFGGCDIREVGLYETIDGEDKLFALGTQQPFVKPEILDNYLITIDYYIFLKSQTLAYIYDKIILDPFTQLVSESDLEDLMSTILFSQTNLMDQIGANSEIIGFDRPTQLYDLISIMRSSSANSIAYSNFTNLLGFVNSDSIFGYWLFNYPKINTTSVAITDISYSGNNLRTSKQVNLLPQEYIGDTSFLTLEPNDYFSLSNDKVLLLTDEAQTQDEPFSMLFCVKPLSVEVDRTLLACSNYATGSHAFEIKELSNGRIHIRLFTNASNYITYTSPINTVPNDVHVLGISYTPTNHVLNVFLNGLKVSMTTVETGNYTHMSLASGTIYGYSATPLEDVYTDDLTNKNHLYNEDGTPTGASQGWTVVPISGGKEIRYYNNVTQRNSSKDFTLGKLYCWMGYTGTDFVYTKEDPLHLRSDSILYNSDYSVYNGNKFQVYYVDGQIKILFYSSYAEYYESGDIPAKELYCFEYEDTPQIIWANSNSNPAVLLQSNGDEYTGTEWTCSEGVIKYLNKYVATYESSQNKEVAAATTGSYIVNSSNEKADLINSKVGIIVVTKTNLTDEQLRLLSLLLYSCAGRNPCIALS